MEFEGGALAGQAYDGPSTAKMVHRASMKHRLADAVAEAESRLADAKRAKEIFDAHPELEELLNIMQRGRF
jgi:hypothetical protein